MVAAVGERDDTRGRLRILSFKRIGFRYDKPAIAGDINVIDRAFFAYMCLTTYRAGGVQQDCVCIVDAAFLTTIRLLPSGFATMIEVARTGGADATRARARANAVLCRPPKRFLLLMPFHPAVNPHYKE
jgi:hypothetical protein